MISLYGLFDPRQGRREVYIGATKSTLPQRIANHFSAAKLAKHQKNHKERWLDELRALKLKPVVMIFGQVPFCTAAEAEARLIKLFKRLRGKHCLNGFALMPYAGKYRSIPNAVGRWEIMVDG